MERLGPVVSRCWADSRCRQATELVVLDTASMLEVRVCTNHAGVVLRASLGGPGAPSVVSVALS
jgi:hypothetical protein